MSKFYFTYGTSGQPFFGGWTEIQAADLTAACKLFRSHHPDRTKGLLNCSSVYDEKQFRQTIMAQPDGNFGFHCHERIDASGATQLVEGVVVTTKNEVFIQSYERPLYLSLNKTVDGPIEIVHPRGLGRPMCMIVNEEGLLRQLPLNMYGSYLYGTHQHGHPIVGNIVILKEGYTDEGPDVVGMTEEECTRIQFAAKQLIDKFTNI